MVFIAYGCNNNAVWNALKLHVNFVNDLEEKISFLVHKKHYDIVKMDYPNHTIYSYTSMFDLMIKLIKIEESDVFSPVTYTTLLSFPAKIIKSKNIYYWVQGSVPEESYLRHKSKLKYYILSIFEYLSLTVASQNIFVSTYMQEYLEQKFHKNFTNSIIVPCISEFSYDGSLKEKDSFVYIGGMSAWQRVDKMLKMFNQILQYKPKARLYIATLDTAIAKEEVAKYLDPKDFGSVEVLSITNREKILFFLSTKEYGFLIREDIVVNNVSSPIKLAEYLSCGVNVIISDAVKSYAPMVEQQKAGISINIEDNIIEKLKGFQHSTVNSLNVYQQYFSREEQLKSYTKLLNSKEMV